MVFRGVGGYLADARDLPREGIDVGKVEIGLGFMGHCEQVQHGVGRASHGYVERHCVEECLAGSYRPGENALVAFFIIGEGVVDDEPGGFPEEFDAVPVGREDGAVAGKGESESLREAVHGICREHSRAASASGA